ncbi:MAG: winged helix-turn-helix domain-containing protein [Dokdonella sp.]|nr:winged helix-turn-helix domain-containing protein [Dokdonella sp.]
METIRFGDYQLDPALRELWHRDERVALPPRAFDCLAYLIDQRGRAIGRDELIAAVWGRVDATDNLVDQIILRCRRAIGDTGPQRYAIRTVPRFGYAWIAEVSAPPSSAAAPAGLPPAHPSAPASTRPRRRRTQAAMLLRTLRRIAMPGPARRWPAALLASLGLLIGGGTPLPSAPRAAIEPKAIVLPVQFAPGHGQAWMRLGLMDAIAERLRAAGLPVLPSDNVVALARRYDPDDIAEAAVADALAAAVAPSWIFGVHAEPADQGWTVRVRGLYGPEPRPAGHGSAADPLAAAYLAADDLAHRLALAPPAAATGSDAHDRARLLQQVKAAAWAEQHDHARTLLQAAAPGTARRSRCATGMPRSIIWPAMRSARRRRSKRCWPSRGSRSIRCCTPRSAMASATPACGWPISRPPSATSTRPCAASTASPAARRATSSASP